MRLRNLQLRAFGHFTDRELDFSAPADGLQLVYGPNEAGKSTALRAVTSFLFGIHGQTTDAFVHDQKKLLIGATLEHDGDTLVMLRRKGNKNTLLDSSGQPINESQLGKWLGGVDQSMFGLMFGLDHEALREGAQMLLDGNGAMGESLFGAAFGGSAIRKVLDRLAEDAEGIFKAGASKPRLNAAIAAFAEAKKHLDRGIAASDWKARTAELARRDAESDDLTQKLGELRETARQLERVQLALEPLARLTEVDARRLALRGVVMLSTSATSERISAVQAQAEAIAARATAQARLESLRVRQASLVVPERLLAHAATISVLGKEIGNHESESRDLPRVQGELRGAEDEARRLLKELGRGESLDQADTVFVDARTAARVSKLAKQQSGIEAPLASLVHDRERRIGLLRAAKQQKADLAAPIAVTTLTACQRRIRKHGDLEEKLAEATMRVAAKERELAAQLSRLGRWTGRPDQRADQLAALPVPSRETCEAAANVRAGLEQRRARVHDELAKQQDQASAHEQELRALEIAGKAPTEEDLADARATRERSWQAIRAAWSAGSSGTLASLAVQHERDVLEADTLADRLRREADRVAQHARIQAESEATRRRVASLSEERALAQRALEEAATEWEAHWRAAGVSPLSPREMVDWLARLERAAQTEAEVCALRDTRKLEASKLESLTQELRALLPGASGGSLNALLDEAESLSTQSERVESSRTRLDDDIARIEAELVDVEAAIAEKRLARAAWTAEWMETVAVLSVAADATVEEVEEVLARSARLVETMKTVSDRKRRVGGMERNAATRRRQLGELTTELAPELANLPWQAAAEELLQRVAQGTRDRQERVSTDEAVLDEERRAHELDARRATAEATLQVLVSNAGATDLQTLEVAEERAAEARRLDEQREKLAERLLGIGNGRPPEELRAEASGFSIDRLPEQLAAVRRELTELDGARAELDQERGAMRNDLARLDGSRDAAASSAAQLEHQIATIRQLTGEYLRPHLARHLLTREINAYRERHQGPLLRRASAIFKVLTLERYVRLEEGFGDDDQPVLSCVRAEAGGERSVDVSALSDGTRDQLFLALRLASLEHHTQRGVALPVVLDDVLIHFDDARARAGLQALAELATKTQVILFTHHERIVELARGAIPAARVRIHDLSEAGQ